MLSLKVFLSVLLVLKGLSDLAKAKIVAHLIESRYETSPCPN